MKKMKTFLARLIPVYATIPLLVCVTYNMAVYGGTNLLTRSWYHYDLTTSADRMVPFIPAWIYIYFSCYLFWIANYMLAPRVMKKEEFYRFVTAELLAKTVCLICFLVLPTTNVRPEVTGTDFASMLMRFLYTVDLPSALFPSIHCLESWFCWIAVRGNAKVPRWYRIFSLVYAVAVCASTQFTKQHYLIDIVGALALSEGMWFLVHKVQWSLQFQKLFTWINIRLGLE